MSGTASTPLTFPYRLGSHTAPASGPGHTPHASARDDACTIPSWRSW